MLQIANNRYPNNWLIPIYVVWGLAAIMLVFIILLPESPWLYARRDNKEACLKSPKRLYGNVDGYHYEEEYQIIRQTLAYEQRELDVQQSVSYRDLFTGLNLKRTLIVTIYKSGSLLAGLLLISTYSTCESMT